MAHRIVVAGRLMGDFSALGKAEPDIDSHAQGKRPGFRRAFPTAQVESQ